MFEAPESPWRVAYVGSFTRQDVSTRRPDDAPGKQARREILAGHVAELDRLQRISMRMMVADIVVRALQSLNMHYPGVHADERKHFDELRQ